MSTGPPASRYLFQLLEKRKINGKKRTAFFFHCHLFFPSPVTETPAARDIDQLRCIVTLCRYSRNIENGPFCHFSNGYPFSQSAKTAGNYIGPKVSYIRPGVGNRT